MTTEISSPHLPIINATEWQRQSNPLKNHFYLGLIILVHVGPYDLNNNTSIIFVFVDLYVIIIIIFVTNFILDILDVFCSVVDLVVNCSRDNNNHHYIVHHYFSDY